MNLEQTFLVAIKQKKLLFVNLKRRAAKRSLPCFRLDPDRRHRDSESSAWTAHVVSDETLAADIKTIVINTRTVKYDESQAQHHFPTKNGLVQERGVLNKKTCTLTPASCSTRTHTHTYIHPSNKKKAGLLHHAVYMCAWVLSTSEPNDRF